MIDPVKFNGPQPLAERKEITRFVNRIQFLPGDLKGRWWELNQESRRAGVALDRAALALNPSVTEAELAALIQRISTIEKSIVQSWKLDAQPTKLPEVWKDPITGEPLPNPWLASLGDKDAMKAKEVLLRNDPALAEMFKKLAENPYATVQEIRTTEARRAALAKITYTSKDHDTNPYRSKDVKAAEAQAAFRAEYGDLVAGIWCWEGQTPVALPWATAPIQLDTCSRIIVSLRASPLPGIDDNAIMLARKFDEKIRVAERIAAENEATAAAARAAALRAA